MSDPNPSFLSEYGPWALVTGASEGIGRSFARAIARRSLNLVLVARRRPQLEELALELRQTYAIRCCVLDIDLTLPEACSSVVESVSELDPGLVVCAAGFGSSGMFLKGNLANERNMLELNCGVTAELSWQFGQRLARRGRGGLILMSSIVAFQGVPGSAHYAATKAYVQTLAEGLRLEWKDQGIDVMAVAPGPVATPEGLATIPVMPSSRAKPADLKEACIQAAREVIAEQGVEALSLRDVARRLNISHQTPYRHFASRDHLLAEIMRRCFAEFAAYLDLRSNSSEPGVDLEGMGEAYLAYAEQKPLEYRLMFGTPWPEPAEHPELVGHAVHAFDILRDGLRSMNPPGAGRPAAEIDLDALFIWSTLHGAASISQANVMQHLALEPSVIDRLKGELIERIDDALARRSSRRSEKAE